jgi:arsenical pump membrane protein
MARIANELSALWPALAFLLAGVPLAALLDRLGFFEAAAAVAGGRGAREASVLGLWVLAALTTAVLNLDTTVVLLTPLYLRLARRAGSDPVAVVAIPLLLASFASSVLPVSNLTNLIVADQLHVGTAAFVAHLGVPSVVACTTGWLIYRRRYPTKLILGSAAGPDHRALTIGGLVVAALLAGFVIGPRFGIDPWMTAAAADVVLVVITKVLPWAQVPWRTAAVVAALAAAVVAVVPSGALDGVLGATRPIALSVITIAAGAVANVVNNLPATLIALDGTHHMSWGLWAWLLGVNTAAVVVPIGALANLLWLRVMRAELGGIGVRRYLRVTLPIALPALAAAAGALAIERALVGR